MGFGVFSMELYRKEGIVSYNLSTSGQPLEASLFLVKRVFKQH